MTTTTGPLPAAYLEVLEFERSWPTTSSTDGRRDALILQRFGWNRTRYHAVLVHTLRQPAAEAYDPALVRRLRRLIDRNGSTRRTHPGGGWQ